MTVSGMSPWASTRTLDAYVANSSTKTAKLRATAMANLGGVQAARPIPMERCDQAGMGEAEFLPRCIAAGCSPAKTRILNFDVHNEAKSRFLEE